MQLIYHVKGIFPVNIQHIVNGFKYCSLTLEIQFIVAFYSIATIVGYLMPNNVYTSI